MTWQVENRYRAILESASDGVLVIDADSRILYANPAAEALFGYTQEEMLGEEMTMVVPPELRQSHRDGVARYLATHERHIPWRGVRLPALHSSGRRVTIEASFGAFEQDGQTYFAGVVRNVEVQVAEQRRRETEHEVSRLLAAAPVASEAIAGTLRTVCQHLGWEVGELWETGEDGPRLEAFHVLDERWAALPRSLRHLARGEGLPGRVLHGGQPLWLDDAGSDDTFVRSGVAAELGLYAAVGVPVGDAEACEGVLTFFSRQRLEHDPLMVAALENIGRQLAQYLQRQRAEVERDASLRRERAAREEAEHQTRIREQVLAVVSHDLRNLLGAIRLHVEILGTAPPSEPESVAARRRERLERLDAAVGDMNRLVADLLDISAFETGQLTLEKSAVDVGRLIAQAIELARPLAGAVTLEQVADADLPSLWADEGRLRQVLANLLHNAIKFTPEGGRIEVRASAVGERVVIAVADTGEGIPEDLRAEVVKSFWRAGRRSGGGTGLGLSIVKTLVELHDGEIDIRTRAGGGTEVSFSIPTAPTDDARGESGSGARPASSVWRS